ncbi:MAG: hypothetical protein VKI63_05620 [Cyanobium sp.]|nr:hypothetical protein [Cyanobium sp.]
MIRPEQVQHLLLPAAPDQLVRFTHGNSKLPNSTMVLSFPAGHTCPGAKDCLTRVARHGGPAWTAPDLQFACYAASQERYRATVRNLRWRNFDLLAPLNYGAIWRHLATAAFQQQRSYTRRIRFFESGDAWSRDMAHAVVLFAETVRPMVVYLYTKALPFWIGLSIPDNLRITASWGGRHDELIPGHFPRSARVVQDVSTARSLGLPLDFDDSFAYAEKPVHFAHLVHGWQPAGSPAAKAINTRRSAGEFTGYGSRPHALPTAC